MNRTIKRQMDGLKPQWCPEQDDTSRSYSKTYTQQELEEYARQKQLELLDELTKSIGGSVAYENIINSLKKVGVYMVVHYHIIKNILNKKREQLTSSSDNEKIILTQLVAYDLAVKRFRLIESIDFDTGEVWFNTYINKNHEIGNFMFEDQGQDLCDIYQVLFDSKRQIISFEKINLTGNTSEQINIKDLPIK